MEETLEAAMHSVAALEGDRDEDGPNSDCNGENIEEMSEAERLEAAVVAVASGGMSYRDAQSTYNIGKMRIQRRVSGQVEMGARKGVRSVLTPGEEAGIVETILKRNGRMTSKEVAAFVRKTVESSPYERLIPASFPSLRWVSRFQKRHKLSKRKPASVTERVSLFYAELSVALKLSPELPSSRIWNLGEFVYRQEAPKGKKGSAKGKKTATKQQSDDRTDVSALVCVNADGGHVPPFFILPEAAVSEDYTNNSLTGSAFGASTSAFITMDIFRQYLEWFVDNIPAARPVVLVVMDGCSAHIPEKTLEHARNIGILIHTLPAHTSHFLQPLTSVFGQLQREIDNEIDAFRVRNAEPVTKYNMVEVASIALPRCWTRTHIVSGFETTGIYPLSKEIMLHGIVEDGPVEKNAGPVKKAMILLKPTLITSERTLNRLKRDGLDPDTVRVLSLNEWDMVEAQERKKPKRAKAD